MLVKCAGVLASLALFGVTVATKGWKFVLVPANQEETVEFHGGFAYFDTLEEKSEMPRDLKSLDDKNTFVWEGELDNEAQQKFTLLALFGKSKESGCETLYFYRNELNLSEASEDEDGHKVLTIQYSFNDRGSLKAPRPSQNNLNWCGTCNADREEQQSVQETDARAWDWCGTGRRPQ